MSVLRKRRSASFTISRSLAWTETGGRFKPSFNAKAGRRLSNWTMVFSTDTMNRRQSGIHPYFNICRRRSEKIIACVNTAAGGQHEQQQSTRSRYANYLAGDEGIQVTTCICLQRYDQSDLRHFMTPIHGVLSVAEVSKSATVKSSYL